tara:strand:- start:1254 stop:1481 length:228 start_codon:yes stop_codon:yes gene_type:complete
MLVKQIAQLPIDYEENVVDMIEEIEKLKALGKSNPKVRGWGMNNIVDEIGIQFGEGYKPFARDYILKEANLNEGV